MLRHTNVEMVDCTINDNCAGGSDHVLRARRRRADDLLEDGKIRHNSVDPWVQLPKTGTWVRHGSCWEDAHSEEKAYMWEKKTW